MLDADFNTWPEDLRSDEDLSSGFDEDSSEGSSSLEEGLSDAEESVNADGSAQASFNDGLSSYMSSEAAEESEDCDSAGQESSQDSTSSGGQAGWQPDFLTPALSQVTKLVLSTHLHFILHLPPGILASFVNKRMRSKHFT